MCLGNTSLAAAEPTPGAPTAPPVTPQAPTTQAPARGAPGAPETAAEPEPPATDTPDTARAAEAPEPTSESTAPEPAGGHPSTESDADGNAQAAADPAAGSPASAAPRYSEPLEHTASSGAPALDASETAAPGLFDAKRDAASESGSPLTRRGGLEFGGYLRGDCFVGQALDANRASIKAAYGELALRLVGRHELGLAEGELRVRYGLHDAQEATAVDLRQAFVTAYLGRLDVSLGKQIVNWGKTDVINPTNNVTPFDLRVRSPHPDDRRQGNVLGRAEFDLEPVRLEGIWVPLYAPIQYPPVVLPERVVVTNDFPDTELQNGLFAAKSQLELPSFEGSLSYVYGHNLLPGIALSSFSVGEDAQVSLARTPHRQQVVGMDAALSVLDWVVVRGEAAYKHPYRDRGVHVPEPELSYVLGVERQFGELLVTLQYLGKYVKNWQPKPGPAEPLDLEILVEIDEEDLVPLVVESIVTPIEAELAHRNQILFQQTERLQHMASLRLEWRLLYDALSLSALGLINTSTREWLVYPKASYSIDDQLSVSLGAELYRGPTGTLFDVFEKELSAGYAELKASF